MKRLFKLNILLTAMIMAVMVSCKEEEKVDTKVAVTGIRLNQPGPVTLPVNETLVLTATVEPSNATNKGVVWSNNKFGVITMVDGMIIGLSPGTVTVTATAQDGSVSASIEITVPPVSIASFALQEERIKIQPGETTTLTCIFSPPNATNKTVTWSSSDPNIASVDEVTGEIIGEMEGTAIITATAVAGGLTAQCTVLVTTSIDVTGVSLTQSMLELVVGHSTTIGYTVNPNNATDQGVTWSSGDSDIVSIDEETGEITAIAPGTATITVTTVDGGYEDHCTVTVPENHIFNPGFEQPDDTTVTGINDANFAQIGWNQVMAAWFDEYYKNDPHGAGGAPGAQGAPNRLITSDAGFSGSGNFAFFAAYKVGNWVGRCGQGSRQGVYQILTVIPGQTYEFSIIIGFGQNGAANVINDWETVKLLSPDGLTTYHLEPIDTSDKKSAPNGNQCAVTTVTGEFTPDPGVTKVRFQVDQRHGGTPTITSPLMLFDDCMFRLKK